MGKKAEYLNMQVSNEQVNTLAEPQPIQLKELTDAFSRINQVALQDERLISNHVLSKAPNYNDIARRFLLKEPIVKYSYKQLAFWTFLFKLVAKYLVCNFGHLAFIIVARLAMFLSGFKAANLQDLAGKVQPLLLLDTFMLVPKVASEGKYREGYLTGLTVENKRRVYILRLYGSRNPLLIYKAFKVLAAQKQYETEPFLALSDLHPLLLKDYFALLKHIILFPLSLFKLINSLKIDEPNSAEAYIKESLINCFGQCYLIPEARRLAAIRIAESLQQESSPQKLRESCLVSWHENQVINKAFYYGLRQGFKQFNPAKPAPKAPVALIGAQLFIWPENLLNCHPDAVDIPLGLAPELTLYSGQHFMPTLAEQESASLGANKFVSSFKVGPSLRYKPLFELAEAGLLAVDTTKPILILLSYHPDETRRVLELVAPLAATSAALSATQGVSLLYRFHPASQASDFHDLLPDNYQSATGDLYELFTTLSLVIGSGSGSLAEAAALGLPVINIDDASGIAGLGLNYLPAFGKGVLWQNVCDLAQLQEAKEQLFSALALPERPQLVAEFRAQLFTKPTKELIEELF